MTPFTEDEMKQLAEHAEAGGWRKRDFNGQMVWALRGFDGSFTFAEALCYICQGWGAQRLANLVKPWWRTWSAWLTILPMFGGFATALINELAGSHNQTISALGISLGTAAPFIGKFIRDQAEKAAALDMRKADEFWAVQPRSALLAPPRPNPGPVDVGPPK